MTVSIFGKSTCSEGTEEYDNAYMIGKLLAEKEINIVTGAYGGVMEAALRGAEKSNVKRIGVSTKELNDRKVNGFISENIETETYLQRLEKLINISDAYIFLPGGTGTLLELSAVWSLAQRNIISGKPIVCIGETWENIVETVAFYSENALSSMQMISFAKNAEEAATIIIDKMKK